MSKGLRTFLIICAGLIIVGTVLGAAGYALGGSNGTIPLWGNNHINLGRTFGAVKEESQNLKAFENMDLDMSLSQVDLIESTEFKVEYSYAEKLGKMDIHVENGTLYVIEKKDRHFFNMDISDLFRGNNGDYNLYLRVYYPKGTKFGDVNVDMDMGSLNLKNLACGMLDVDLNMGSLEVDTVIADYAKINLDMGGVESRQFVTQGLEADSSMGSLELNGTFAGTNKLSCDMGSIEFNTTIPESQYNYTVETDMGSSNVREGTTDNGQTKNTIDADASMGDITLNFGN